jgi:hypothetical protein
VLANSIYYWGTIRKIVTGFGSLFSDISIIRTDDTVNPPVLKQIKVPLSYGPKEKWFYRTKQNPTLGVDDGVEMVLPRMSFEINGYVYDTSRKLTSTGRTVKVLTNDNTVVKAQFNPVPYNIGFTLNIATKTIEDGHMIIEQILPFFTPDYTFTITDIPELALKKDISIVLNGFQQQDTWDSEFTERRTITWEFSFTAKAYLYPPTKLTKVIVEADVNYTIDGPNAGSLSSIKTIPYPTGANAETVTSATDIRIDGTVKVLVTPSATTLAVNQSKQFTINVINTSDPTFTASLTPNVGTAVIVGDKVTYTAPSSTVSQQVITLRTTSHDDPTKFAEATILLTP